MIDIGKLVERLRDLSDFELQKHEWVELRETTVYYFSEMESQLFDDTGISHYLDIDRCPDELDKKVFLELKKLDKLASCVDIYLPPERLLHAPEMIRVRKQASVILDMLNCSDNG